MLLPKGEWCRPCRTRPRKPAVFAVRPVSIHDVPKGVLEKKERHETVRQESWERIQSPDLQQATLAGPLRLRFVEGFNQLSLQANADPLERHRASEAVNALTLTLQRMPRLKVSLAQVAGSFGRGTHVSASFDVDVIMFAREWDGAPLVYPDDFDRGGRLERRVMRQLREWLAEQQTPWSITPEDDSDGYRLVLQLTVGEVEVDLLLLPDCVEGRVEDHAKQQHAKLMHPLYAQIEAREGSPGPCPPVAYSQPRERAVSEAMNIYLRQQEEDVKCVVRLLKAWHKHGCDVGRSARIPSVVLELLVIAAHRRLSLRRPKVARVEAFMEALRLLERAVREPGCVVAVDAGEWGYRPELGAACERVWGRDPVRVLHPVDPTCNLARPRLRRTPDWDTAAEEARCLRERMQVCSFGQLLSDTSLGRAVTALRSR